MKCKNVFVKFKDNQKYSDKDYEEYKTDGEYIESDYADSFVDCGLKLNENEIRIDIDHISKDVIKSMIETFSIKTQMIWTDRGVHLCFKKPNGFKAKNGVCALGFDIEVKTSSNTYATVIKKNGVMRKIENAGTLEELPYIFMVDKRFENLSGLDDGDNRNSMLYKHKLILKNHDGWEKILSFINEYVFMTPLPQSEFEIVSRQEIITNSETNENYFADLIMNQLRCVVYAGDIWFYYNDRYITNDNMFKRLVYQICGDRKTRFIDEVIKQIQYKSKYIQDGTNFDIKLKNGILRDGKWIEINSMEFTPYFIDIEYDEKAKPVEIVDNYIHDLTDGETEYRNLLLEVMAYPLVLKPSIMSGFGKFFMFRGDGANGKSTMLDILRTIYNVENCTSMSIKQLTDDRFKSTLSGKLANLGDDIEPEAINNDQLKVLKNITTGDTVTTRKLYCNAENITFTTKLFFTTNSNIKSWDKGYAFQRRVMWMPMFNKVKKIDPNFKEKITSVDALSYWVKLIVDAYFRLMKAGTFTESPKVSEFNQQYHDHNDKMKQFILECGGNDGSKFHLMTIKELKNAFYNWNDEEDASWNSKLFKIALWNTCKMGIGNVTDHGISKKVILKAEETQQSVEPIF